MLTAGRILFALGSAVGWYFRHEAVTFLTDPWQVSGLILEVVPTPSQMLRWYLLIAATAGTLFSLPIATWLAWELVARRSCPQGRRHVFAFLLTSYVALGVSFGVAVRVALPALVDAQRDRWGILLVPVPWVWLEAELSWVIDIALAAQLIVIVLERARARLGVSSSASSPPEPLT